MHFSSPDALAGSDFRKWTDGPVLVILCEDSTELLSTLAHHVQIGFRSIILALPPGIAAPEHELPGVHTLAMPPHDGTSFAPAAVNAAARALPPGHWLGYVFNAEYLFFPFAETRSIAEALQFCTEERRDSLPTHVVDLYARERGDTGVDLETAHLDRSGYYGQQRWEDGAALERQMDIFGGLRWRFEEYVPWERRRIDRIGLFRTDPGVALLETHLTTDPERNTYECPWHHSMTAAICSFRAAKALARNPDSRARIDTFMWQNSVPCEWDSRQLLELGFMEPGQWF